MSEDDDRPEEDEKKLSSMDVEERLIWETRKKTEKLARKERLEQERNRKQAAAEWQRQELETKGIAGSTIRHFWISRDHNFLIVACRDHRINVLSLQMESGNASIVPEQLLFLPSPSLPGFDADQTGTYFFRKLSHPYFISHMLSPWIFLLDDILKLGITPEDSASLEAAARKLTSTEIFRFSRLSRDVHEQRSLPKLDRTLRLKWLVMSILALPQQGSDSLGTVYEVYPNESQPLGLQNRWVPKRRLSISLSDLETDSDNEEGEEKGLLDQYVRLVCCECNTPFKVEKMTPVGALVTCRSCNTGVAMPEIKQSDK